MINCEDVFYQEIGITCKTFARLKVIERENKMMRECIEFVIANSGTSTNYNLKCRETLNKLTKDER